jgi:hypothetical protein
MPARISVRRADLPDIPWLLIQLRAFAETYQARIPLYPGDEYAANALTVLMTDHVVLVAERDYARMGLICGCLMPHFMNPGIQVLVESVWWVAPEYRHTRAALSLLQEFIAIGKAKADWITVATEGNSALTDKALTKRGFKHIENNYLMECR